jgi:hypothetical protein
MSDLKNAWAAVFADKYAAARGDDVGKLEKEHPAPTIPRIIQYLNAERQACMKTVCKHCRGNVPYNYRSKRHDDGVREMCCHAQLMRDRPDVSELLQRDLNMGNRDTINNMFKKQYSVAQHAKLMGSLVHAHYSDDPYGTVACDACNGEGKIGSEECWHCSGDGIDPTK